MMLAASAAELLILYLGLELMTLCSYILVGDHARQGRLERGRNQVLPPGFLRIGPASLRHQPRLRRHGRDRLRGDCLGCVRARPRAQHPLLLVGVALVVGGLAFKIAAVPFHAWAPDAYQGASAPVAAFLAAGSKAAGLAALGRVCLVAFASEQRVWSDILIGLAALSMVVGSLLAVSQTNMKRLLAYSSIAHAGYALLGLISGTADGASATMTYAFVYAFMTLGAFGVVVGLGERGESWTVIAAWPRRAPWTAALMFLFLLSLTGIPPTAGFAAKFGVILSAVRAGHIVSGGPGCAVQRRLRVLLPARGRPHVHDGAAGIGARPLSCCGVRGTRGRRVRHDCRRHLPGHASPSWASAQP